MDPQRACLAWATTALRKQQRTMALTHAGEPCASIAEDCLEPDYDILQALQANRRRSPHLSHPAITIITIWATNPLPSQGGQANADHQTQCHIIALAYPPVPMTTCH